MSSNNLGNMNDLSEKDKSKGIIVVFFASVIAFMGLGLVDPILPAISSQLGASQSETTLLFTGYNAIMLVAMLITGYASSRLGIKRTLIVGVGIISIFASLCGLANNVWTIIGLRCVWGLGNALFVATALTAILNLSSRTTEKSVILYETSIGIGFSVGPVIGGILGEIAWRYPFFGVGLLMLVAFLLIYLTMPNIKDLKSKNKKLDQKSKNISILDPIRALKYPAIKTFGVSAFFYNFGFFTLFAYTPFVLGLSAFGIGMVFLGWGIMLALNSTILAPKIQRRFGVIKPMIALLSILSVVLFIMGIWTSIQWVIIIAVIISGALIGNNNTLMTTAVMNSTPIERSTASASYSFLRFIGSAIAPFLAGFLGEKISPHTPFLVGGIFVIASIIVVLINHKHIKHVDFIEEQFGEKVIKVKDFIIQNVVSIKPDATIKELLETLFKHHIGGFPVVDNESRLIDIVSGGDIIRYFAPKEGSVHDLMYDVYFKEDETEQDVIKQKMKTKVNNMLSENKNKKIYSVDEEDNFEKVITILSKHNFKKIPVLDSKNRVIGIISRGDINSNLLKMINEKN